MKKKRRVILALCGVLLVAGIGTAVWWNVFRQPKEGTPDLINRPHYGSQNINTLVQRGENWKKLVDMPLFDEERELFLIDGSTATVPITAELLRQYYGYTDEEIDQSPYVAHSTTHTAYENLIHRRTREFSEEKNGLVEDGFPVSILFATPPSDDELAYAESYGVTLDCRPIALDGFVFITHKNNPVDSLTVEQIQKIYSGEIANWKDVGGDNRKIQAYQREAGSGSQTAMEQLVMRGKPMKRPIQAQVAEFMGDLVDFVAEYKNGPASIGYTFNYYINNLYKSPDIKVLRVEGITPEEENLIDENYPFTAAYYAVIRPDEPGDSKARALRDFLLSEQGQELVEMAGYCKAR